MKQKKEHIKISVIMPVYNMEKYLLAAIESFLMQSLDQIELICIDDMSSDNSVRIISDVANDNENIHLFQMKRNEGVGIARRKGMSLAAGEYIAFIDADDLLMKKDALELLYNAAVSDDCDICAGFVTNFNDKCETPYPRFRSLFSSDKRIIKDVSYIDIQDDYYFQGFIYKRKFLEEHEIVFPPYIRNEDPPFLVQALHKANKIRVVGIEFYGHREGHKEIKYTDQSILDLLNGFIMNLEYADEHGLDILFEKTVIRLNTEYLKPLIEAVCFRNILFVERLIYAGKLAKKHGFKLDILDYISYLQKKDDRVDEFRFLSKCVRKLNGKKRIILYGAGNVGKKIYELSDAQELCDVVLWVDRFKEGEKINGVRLADIRSITHMAGQYDCVLIGIDDMAVTDGVRQDLVANGVSSEQIIEWCDR